MKMLRTCFKDEYEKYINFDYQLVLDLTKPGYSMYCDDVKNEEMFTERF